MDAGAPWLVLAARALVLATVAVVAAGAAGRGTPAALTTAAPRTRAAISLARAAFGSSVPVGGRCRPWMTVLARGAGAGKVA